MKSICFPRKNKAGSQINKGWCKPCRGIILNQASASDKVVFWEELGLGGK